MLLLLFRYSREHQWQARSVGLPAQYKSLTPVWGSSLDLGE